MLRRAFLRLIAAGVATATGGAIAAIRAPPFNVTNIMPAFWRFWNATLEQSTDQRVRAFFDSVVAPYPDLFQHGLIAGGALTDLGDTPGAQARVAKYLQDVLPFIPAMRQITVTIRDHFPRYVQEFSTTFPDYGPTTPVYFSLSLFGFAGGLRVADENADLYFGVDELARMYRRTSGLKVILQHELFHQYHDQIAPEISRDRAAWAFMWEEGLATYVSQRMNPGTTEDQALVIPERLSELTRPHLSELARRLLDRANSTNAADYMDLFSPEQAPAGLPPRSGYFLGYTVAVKLAATRSLGELVHWRGSELKRGVLGALEELQRGG